MTEMSTESAINLLFEHLGTMGSMVEDVKNKLESRIAFLEKEVFKKERAARVINTEGAKLN